MNTIRNSRRHAALALALASGALAVLGMTPTAVRAQSSATAPNEKINLMVDALQARDDGDLAKAQDLLKRLVVLAPNDTYVQEMLASVNSDLQRKSQGQPTVFAQATPSAPTAAPVTVRPLPAAPAPAQISTTPAAATPGPAAPAPAAPAPAAAAPAAPAEDPAAAAAKAALAAQQAKGKQVAADVQKSIAQSESLSAAGKFDDALKALDQAQVPDGTVGYDDLEHALAQARGEVILQQIDQAYRNRKNEEAKKYLANYIAAVGQTDSKAKAWQNRLDAARWDPTRQDIDQISPGFTAKQDQINDFLVQGRAQYLYGDYQGALKTFSEAVILDPDSIEASAYILRIEKLLGDRAYIDYQTTREGMLMQVDKEWKRPDVFIGKPPPPPPPGLKDPIELKMKSIIIPNVQFKGADIQSVVDSLTTSSGEYDTSEITKENPAHGVNIMLVNPNKGGVGTSNATVTTSLSNASLWAILTGICDSIEYSFDIDPVTKFVMVRAGGSGGGAGSGSQFITQDFAMPAATLTHLTGKIGGDSGGGGTADPFKGPTAAPSTSSDDTESALKSFFVKAGVDFPDGSRIAYDNSKIWVTNTQRNLDKLTGLLQRYTQIKQVQIESRFLEVQENALQQLGFTWNVFSNNPNNTNNFLRTAPTPASGATLYGSDNTLQLLSNAFPLGNSGAAQTTIDRGSIDPVSGAFVAGTPINVPQSIPSIPNGIGVGSGASAIMSGVLGVVNGYNIQMVINALEQTTGADLMSAPVVTVTSQQKAEIVVAQQLMYPTSFQPTASQVGQQGGGNGNGGGAAGVTITAGTPENFNTQEVGVTMDVQPTVEENNTISMSLDPQVTEFEGFIEYGGTSVAISGGTTVTVPSGFIQPVFSIRRVHTQITIFDGATVMMGGLTREEIKTVHDKVPVLGDIPLLGRLFQSKGETSSKRNLMIFVTANLVGAGGGPVLQALPGLPPGSTFQMPEYITPSRAVPRGIPESDSHSSAPASN